PTEADVLNIYNDLSKLADIERYLNLLYRPFTCFLNTQCQYNLRKLRLCLPDSNYEPDRHMALVTTHRQPSGTIKIYANGNISCQAFTHFSAFKALTNFSEALAELGGYTPSLIEPKFNLVNATFCMPFPLDLQAIEVLKKPHTVYIPNEHPFLTYSIPGALIKFAIFPTGYVYVMFSNRPYDTQQAIVHILPILYACRATSQPNQSDLELSHGDINFQLLWEKEFQSNGDFSIHW
ncbi:hypothetical protein KR032_003128, partial [Drosophila birchii]